MKVRPDWSPYYLLRFLGHRRFGLVYKHYFAEDVRDSCFTFYGKVTQLQSTQSTIPVLGKLELGPFQEVTWTRRVRRMTHVYANPLWYLVCLYYCVPQILHSKHSSILFNTFCFTCEFYVCSTYIFFASEAFRETVKKLTKLAIQEGK